MGSFLSSSNSTISAPPTPQSDPQLSENKPTAEIMKTPKEDPKPVTNPATLPFPPNLISNLPHLRNQLDLKRHLS